MQKTEKSKIEDIGIETNKIETTDNVYKKSDCKCKNVWIC